MMEEDVNEEIFDELTETEQELLNALEGGDPTFERLKIFKKLILLHISRASRPVTSVDLMKDLEVIKEGRSLWPNERYIGDKITNALGYMWRQGKLDKHPVNHDVEGHIRIKNAYCLPGKFPEYSGQAVRNKYADPAEVKLTGSPKELKLMFNNMIIHIRMRESGLKG